MVTIVPYGSLSGFGVDRDLDGLHGDLHFFGSPDVVDGVGEDLDEDAHETGVDGGLLDFDAGVFGVERKLVGNGKNGSDIHIRPVKDVLPLVIHGFIFDLLLGNILGTLGSSSHTC